MFTKSYFMKCKHTKSEKQTSMIMPKKPSYMSVTDVWCGMIKACADDMGVKRKHVEVMQFNRI